MIRPFGGRSAGGGAGPFWRRLTLRDAVLFTVPPLLLLAYLLVSAVVDYHESLQFDDWWSRGRSVQEFFAAKVKRALRLPEAASLVLRLDPSVDDPGTIRLRVPQDVWAEVEQNPLEGWGRWMDATLVRPGGSQDVDLRKRGDTSIHWTTGKLSFTLETPRSELFRGIREASISQKSVLTQYVTNSLPNRFGLLTPFTTVTPVFLNERYYGIFRFTEEVDEAFLRRHGRMPGNLFRADAAERSEYYKGLPRAVFRNPYIWERVAEADVPGVAPDSALLELIRAVNGSSFESHLELMSLVERDEIARLLAATLVVGDPYHMSGVHNQFWYEDPSTGLLHPIPWDLRLLELGSRPGRVNEFFRAALRDPFLADRTLAVVRDRMEAGLYGWAERTTRSMYERYAPHIEYDRLRSDIIDDPGAPEEILPQLRENLRTLEAWMADATTRFHAAPAGDGTLVLDLAAAGYAGSDLTGLRLPGADLPAAESTDRPRLVADRNRNGVRDASDRVVPGRWRRSGEGVRFEADEPVALLPGWDTRRKGIRPGTVHYRFFLEGTAPSTAGEAGVEPVLANRITGEPAEVVDWETDGVIPPDAAFSPWRFPRAGDPPEIRLEGEVRLTEDLFVPRGGRLTVEPGTRVVLAPDVSIVSRGRVDVRGTAERPVRFEAPDPRVPWGTLALQGPGADGSRFRHAEFRSGGGATVGRVDYTGMISVYRADDVRFSNLRVADNLRSDDALRGLHAGIRLSDCEFVRANSDAIDFDHSEGVITGCTFRDAGNDAIDLMTSRARITDNTITGSGDKGISIGESSHPLIVNNTITASARGIEVKDASEPVVIHNTIRGNGMGVFQQVKNWRYGTGGHAKLAFNRIEQNDRQVVNDRRSRLTAFGNRVVPPVDTAAGGAVAGADSALLASAVGATTPRPGDEVSAWLHRRLGWTDAPEVPGALPARDVGPTLAPADSVTFREGFDLGLRSWARGGGVSELHRRQRRLVISARERPGVARRTLGWELAAAGGPHEAALEAAGRGLDSAVVVFRREGGPPVRRRLRLGSSVSAFGWTLLRLPPGRYDAVELRLHPIPGNRRVDPATGLVEVGTARLDLRGLWLYSEDGAGAPTGGPGERAPARAASTGAADAAATGDAGSPTSRPADGRPDPDTRTEDRPR